MGDGRQMADELSPMLQKGAKVNSRRSKLVGLVCSRGFLELSFQQVICKITN